MGAAWALPGYDVQELVGFGGSGEVWRAIASDSGDEVALKRLHTTDAVARERLRREAAVLSSVAGEHVVRVRDVVLSDAAAVLVMDYAPGGNLATVLAVRKRIAAPEIVTLVAPLAGALSDAHDRGIVHGDVTPANIVFTADGRPLLGDFGVARAVGAPVEGGIEGTPAYLAPEVRRGSAPAPPADVWSLCAIATEAIDRTSAPDALLDALARGLVDDPDERVDARSLMVDVLRSCAAAPVGLVRAPLRRPASVTQPVRPASVTQPVRAVIAPEPEPPGARANRPRPSHAGRRRAEPSRARPRCAGLRRTGPKSAGAKRGLRLPRPVTVALVSALALLLAAAGGVALGHRTQSAATMLAAPPAPAPAATHATATAAAPRASLPDWTAVVAGLDAARSRAFARADVAMLAQVYAPRSRPLALDRAALQAIAARGMRALGLTQTTVRVRPVVETPTDVTLLVTDVISAYRLVDVTGRVVSVGAARPARTFTMDLTQTAAGWRIKDISGD